MWDAQTSASHRRIADATQPHTTHASESTITIGSKLATANGPTSTQRPTSNDQERHALERLARAPPRTGAPDRSAAAAHVRERPRAIGLDPYQHAHARRGAERAEERVPLVEGFARRVHWYAVVRDLDMHLIVGGDRVERQHVDLRSILPAHELQHQSMLHEHGRRSGGASGGEGCCGGVGSARSAAAA